MRPDPPESLDLKLTAPNINLSLDQSGGSSVSGDILDSPDKMDVYVDELQALDKAPPGHTEGQADCRHLEPPLLPCQVVTQGHESRGAVPEVWKATVTS